MTAIVVDVIVLFCIFFCGGIVIIVKPLDHKLYLCSKKNQLFSFRSHSNLLSNFNPNYTRTNRMRSKTHKPAQSFFRKFAFFNNNPFRRCTIDR